ncbi:MAG TPA: aldo/keto reductase [Acidimicrobiales bacterium]|nr:aldo/keto reductase [Acidimicrobiales bacterium]
MQLRVLGSTGMRVSPLCLGAMMLGAWGNGDHDECVRIVHTALGSGVNFVDTADVYSVGESEEVVGKALSGGRRDSVVLATKFHAPMGADPNMAGNSRRWVTRAVDDSLRRLRTDWIDLYQVHRPDPTTDIDDTLGALSDLVHQGKVRAIGSSTFPAELIVEAQWTAERRGRERFECEQPPYSILARDVERAVLPACHRYGMGVIVWSPLNGGWLTGRYRLGQPIPTDSGRPSRVPERFDPSRPAVAAKLGAVEALVPIAAKAGIPLAHLALAFVLTHPAVSSAIIGPRTMEQLTSVLGAPDIALDEEVLDAIDDVVAPGHTVDPADLGWAPPSLTEPWRRRRPAAARAKSATESTQWRDPGRQGR